MPHLFSLKRLFTHHPVPSRRSIALFFWLSVLFLGISGCGSDTSDNPVMHGKFTAFTLKGLEYECFRNGTLTRKGATDDTGHFYYRRYEDNAGNEERETIQFRLGNILLGSSLTPTYQMSPLDFDTSELMSDETINIAAFLQTLDKKAPVTAKSDLDLSDYDCPDDDDFDCDCTDDDCDVPFFPDGITITPEVRDAVNVWSQSRNINFNQPSDQFQQDSDVAALISYLNGENVFEDGQARTLVTTDQAFIYLREALAVDRALPVIMINLGDGLTCGTQSGTGNVHEYTQSRGFPARLSTYASLATEFLTWYSPDIDLFQWYNGGVDGGTYERQHAVGRIDDKDELADNEMLYFIDRTTSADDYIDYIFVPTNLGVDSATATSLINERTTENDLLSTIMEPMMNPRMGSEVNPFYLSPSFTQMEAAEFIAGKYPDRQKIFTLWIGLNDVLGAVTASNSARMTMADIQAFLDDSANGHDETSVITAIEETVARLVAIPDSHVFIANLPHVTSFAALFGPSDLARLATFSDEDTPASVTALAPGDHVGLWPFINRTNEVVAEDDSSDIFAELIPGLEVPIASALGKYYDETNEVLNTNDTLNAAITATISLDDGYTLSSEEAALLNARIDAINAAISTLAAENAHVTLVDVKAGIFDKLDVDYDRILAADGDLKEDSETKRFVLENYVYITTDGDPEDEDDPELKDWEYEVLSRTFGGGFFSLDGIHPSNTGYLIIADAFVTAINEEKLGIDISEISDTAFYSTYSGDGYQDDDGDGFIPGPGYVSDWTDTVDGSITSCRAIDAFYQGLADCSDSRKKTYPPYISGKDTCD